MARKRRSSMVHQVSRAITQMNKIGESKREYRKNNSTGIHSIKQIKETLSAAQNFVKWVRGEFEIKSIYKLTEEHYIAYLYHLERIGRSAGHRQNIETALRHLQKGMDYQSDELGLEKVSFIPAKRITNWRALKKAEDRSYTQNEYEMLMPLLSKNVQSAVTLMRYMGLRVREACNVKVKHFVGELLIIPEGEGRGITKGGRHRITPIPTLIIDEIEHMKRNKGKEDRLINVKPATVRKAINIACKKANIQQDGRGTHGFRHLYCRDRLRELLKECGIEKEGQRMMKRIMYNRDKRRKADYGIFLERDLHIYRLLKNAIDQVHEEIGHGEDRWDLAERYMR